MSGVEELHDDEIRARLGLEIGEGMSGRIEGHVVRSMPEPDDLEGDDDQWPLKNITG